MRATFKLPQLRGLALGLALLVGLLAGGQALTALAADTSVSLGAIAGGGTHRLPSGAFTLNSNCRTGVDTYLNEEYRIALEFDLSSLPPTAEINAVTMRLRAATFDRSGTTGIYGYAGNGTIEASDMTAGTLAATHTPSSPSPEFVDVTASVLDRWNNGDRWAGFTLRQEPLGTTNGGWDCPNNYSPPLLTIEYSAPDSTPPVITHNVVGTEGTNGWYTGDVNPTWSVVDDESPIGNQSGCEPQAVTSDTSADTFTCTASSAGGSSTQSVTIHRDATAPTIAFVDRTAANSSGWNNGDVTVNWQCSDTISGAVAGSVSQTLSGEGADQAARGTCTDQAGNNAADTQSGINIDKTAPVVAVTGVSSGASYPLGSVPAGGCSSTDDLSDVATAATLSLTGGNPDGTGTYTATCSGATDNAGNSAGAVSVTYSVVYRWTGFLQPVDNLPTINTATAGAGIPVKFSLSGDYGVTILAGGYPKVQAVACTGSGSGSSSDVIEETVTAGSSGLQYDAATQTYTYVWKTDKAWAGSCRTLIVKLADGVEHSALFQFASKGRSAAGSGEGELAQRLFLPAVNR